MDDYAKCHKGDFWGQRTDAYTQMGDFGGLPEGGGF